MKIDQLCEDIKSTLEILRFEIIRLQTENKKLRKDIRKLQEDITTIISKNKTGF